MVTRILSYKNEIIVLVIALAYFIWLAAPDVTWINTDSDTGIYTWSTRNWGLSHPTGAPLYNIIGNLINQGADLQQAAQRLSLLSAVTAALTAFVLYRETRNLIAPGVFMAAGLVVSQATIVETYAPVTLTIVLAWHWRSSPRLFPVAMALGIGIHHLIGFTVLPLMMWRYYRVGERTVLYDALGLLAGLSFYIGYYPFATRPEAAWSDSNVFHYFFSQGFLTGGLDPLESGRDRLREVVYVLMGGFGISFIVMVAKVRDKFLWALMGVYIIYYGTNLAPQTYVYLMPVFAFGGIGLGRAWVSMGNYHKSMVSITIVMLMTYNLFVYDIGRNLDQSPTSARIFIEEVEQLPNGSTIIAIGRGWERTLVWNRESENEVEIVTTSKQLEQFFREPHKENTYISVILDPTRYLVRLVRCHSRSNCEFWLDRANGVESDSVDESNGEILHAFLGDNFLDTSRVFQP